MRFTINWTGDEPVKSQTKQRCIVCGDRVAVDEDVYGGVLVWTIGEYGTMSRFVCSHLYHGKPEEK